MMSCVVRGLFVPGFFGFGFFDLDQVLIRNGRTAAGGVGGDEAQGADFPQRGDRFQGEAGIVGKVEELKFFQIQIKTLLEDPGYGSPPVQS